MFLGNYRQQFVQTIRVFIPPACSFFGIFQMQFMQTIDAFIIVIHTGFNKPPSCVKRHLLYTLMVIAVVMGSDVLGIMAAFGDVFAA